jgi:hypothetical protein
MPVVNNSNNGLTFLKVFSGSVLLTTYVNSLNVSGSGVSVSVGTANDLLLTFTGGGGGGSVNTGSLLTTASFSDPNLTFTKGNGSTFPVHLSTLTVINAQTASYIDGGTF